MTHKHIPYFGERRNPQTIGRMGYPSNELPTPLPEGPDIIIRDEGSIFMVRPVSDAGKQWIDDNVPTEPWQWVEEAFSVGHRYITDIIDGMLADGIVVELEESN